MAEDVGHLAHLDHERALPGGQVVGRADAREHAVDHADDGAFRRDERAHLRHEHDERSLAHVRRFTGHVRPGHDGDAVVRVVEERVVRDKEIVLLRLLHDGVAPLADVECAREVDLGADVVVFHRRLRQRAQRVEPGHGVRRRLHACDLARDELAHLIEERILQLRDALARGQERILEILELVRKIALARDQCLLADIVLRQLGNARAVRNVDVIAEDLVVADLELFGAGSLALALLELGDGLRAVVAHVAQAVDLLAVARAENAALAHGKRRLVADGAVDARAEVGERVHLRNVAQGRAVHVL